MAGRTDDGHRGRESRHGGGLPARRVVERPRPCDWCSITAEPPLYVHALRDPVTGRLTGYKVRCLECRARAAN